MFLTNEKSCNIGLLDGMEGILSYGERIQSLEVIKTVSPRLVGVSFCGYILGQLQSLNFNFRFVLFIVVFSQALLVYCIYQDVTNFYSIVYSCCFLVGVLDFLDSLTLAKK